MSLPAIGRPSGGLPPRNTAPITRREAREPEVAADTRPAEVLIITVEEDKDDANNLAVIFEGFGFDIENDEIIIDLLELAARTYGYTMVPEDEDEN